MKTKTVQVSRFLGNINMPSSFELVRDGLTRRGDQVTYNADFLPHTFVTVRVGGINVGRYMAVLRRVKNPSVKRKS